MTAASILEHAQTNDFVIHLFEGNKRLGQKLLISGGGRCNVTTGISDMKTLATKYVRGWEFFQPSISAFSPKKTKKWFESSGVPLKVQPDNRVFPVSDTGEDVLGAFLQIFAKYPQHILIRLSERIESIEKQDTHYALKSAQ